MPWSASTGAASKQRNVDSSLLMDAASEDDEEDDEEDKDEEDSAASRLSALSICGDRHATMPM